jgi:hypothetical protein
LSANKNWTLVVYGRERMMNVAQSFFKRLKSKGSPEEFKVFDNRDRHPEWSHKAERAIHRVAEVWRSVGLTFPVDEVMECW